MDKGENRQFNCQEDNCYRPGPILGLTAVGIIRLCGEHYLQKVDSGEIEGTIGRQHSICSQCPATLCTDFGNGYVSMRDLADGTADYQRGTIYECPILQASVHNPQEGMHVDDTGQVYFEMKSVKDLENGL